jgi:hypothetical protein
MRRVTAVSIGPPLFFVNVASKGVRFTEGVDSSNVLCVGARPFKAQGKHAVTVFRTMAVPTGAPRFFVSVASKGVRSTVRLDFPNVHAAETWPFGALFVAPFAFAQGKQGKRGKYAVPVLSAASVPFVGAQLIAPFSPRPLPKPQCLMPTHLPKRAPKP